MIVGLLRYPYALYNTSEVEHPARNSGAFCRLVLRQFQYVNARTQNARKDYKDTRVRSNTEALLVSFGCLGNLGEAC